MRILCVCRDECLPRRVFVSTSDCLDECLPLHKSVQDGSLDTVAKKSDAGNDSRHAAKNVGNVRTQGGPAITARLVTILLVWFLRFLPPSKRYASFARYWNDRKYYRVMQISDDVASGR